MNIKETDRLLQFILATAGQEDFESQKLAPVTMDVTGEQIYADQEDTELGPVHLIKYLYLADLSYAEDNEGETYTSLPWKFHHFGPWAEEAYLRIEPVLESIGAERRFVQLTAFEYDVRWSVQQDDDSYYYLEKDIPLIITGSVQNYIRKFNAITEDILHFAYNTWPMLRAKPGDLLDFTLPDYVRKKKTDSAIPDLSVRQKKKRKHAAQSLRGRFREKLKAKKRKVRIRFSPPPVYDDIFYEGLEALDLLAGEDMREMEGTVRFSDDIWESKARFDPDVS
ncbi:hypothetical protein QUF72_22195 [Desulfobacterales bacterium HSG2]|nr:hypothetical protein [Desulfobacterales bacterium HSG2]